MKIKKLFDDQYVLEYNGSQHFTQNHGIFYNINDIDKCVLTLELQNCPFVNLFASNVYSLCDCVGNSIPVPTSWDGNRTFTKFTQPMQSCVVFSRDERCHIRFTNFICLIHYNSETIIGKLMRNTTHNQIKLESKQLSDNDFLVMSKKIIDPYTVIQVGDFYISNQPILVEDIIFYVSLKISENLYKTNIILYHNIPECIVDKIKENLCRIPQNCTSRVCTVTSRYGYNNTMPVLKFRYSISNRISVDEMFKSVDLFDFPANLKEIDTEFSKMERGKIIFYKQKKQNGKMYFSKNGDPRALNYIAQRLESF